MGWGLCFPLWLRADELDFRLCDDSHLDTCLWIGWLEPGALAFFWARQVLPVEFLLLRCSVLCTVESLSLLYPLGISWFMCSRLINGYVGGLSCKPGVCMSWSTLN